MKRKNIIVYIVGALIALGVGGLSAVLTMGNMDLYEQGIVQPSLAPPGWLFPVVWTILYTLMGLGSAIIWLEPPSADRHKALNLYVAQLIFNFFWSLIFFNAQAFGFAALWLIALWILVALMIWQFGKVNKIAAIMQIPYLIWLTFAAYLNIAIWSLNP